mmetsp:Transcript_19911/g.46714  ORF Transcript_19911/g.46714 Transcript_19911/m.46714 type:complete len:265 (-) Transcript_19911:55-849(-)
MLTRRVKPSSPSSSPSLATGRCGRIRSGIRSVVPVVADSREYVYCGSIGIVDDDARSSSSPPPPSSSDDGPPRGMAKSPRTLRPLMTNPVEGLRRFRNRKPFGSELIHREGSSNRPSSRDRRTREPAPSAPTTRSAVRISSISSSSSPSLLITATSILRPPPPVDDDDDGEIREHRRPRRTRILLFLLSASSANRSTRSLRGIQWVVPISGTSRRTAGSVPSYSIRGSDGTSRRANPFCGVPRPSLDRSIPTASSRTNPLLLTL